MSQTPVLSSSLGVGPLIMSGLQLAPLESDNENNDEQYRICKVVVWIHDRYFA